MKINTYHRHWADSQGYVESGISVCVRVENVSSQEQVAGAFLSGDVSYSEKELRNAFFLFRPPKVKVPTVENKGAINLYKIRMTNGDEFIADKKVID